MDPVPRLIGQVSQKRLRQHLFHLAKDPLPCRKLNYTLPGHDRCTLYEADDFIAAQLEACGYSVAREGVPVQAFRPDRSKPLPHQFARPEPGDPTYTAYNLYARKTGTELPGEYLVAIAHKDSQSWTDSPGAYDNAVGTVAALELARLLEPYPARRSLWFVFCNEEHTPWTSEVVAAGMARRGGPVRAVLNLDGLGGKAQADVEAGRRTHVTRFVTPEGGALADRASALNRRYGIGLETSKFESERPNDDDGSFVRAGIPAAVLHIGSFPYGNPDYHAAGDVPEKVDLGNVTMAVQLALAALVDVDREV
ncbi:MAG: M28 family peptidase [Gemmatimonadota bacterium]